LLVQSAASLQRFASGSDSAIEQSISLPGLMPGNLMAAAVRNKAVTRLRFFENSNLNGSFHRKQTFKPLDICRNEGQETAKSGDILPLDFALRKNSR
jgi:hypothetical protein